MGLNLVLYNLSGSEPERDTRFDSTRFHDDYTFSAWLNDGHALYRHIGDPHRLDDFLREFDFSAWRKWTYAAAMAEVDRRRAFALLDALELDPMRTQWLTGGVIDINLRDLEYNAEIYERPKDISTARMWLQEHAEWDVAKKRLLGLLDLLESDENLWIYES